VVVVTQRAFVLPWLLSLGAAVSAAGVIVEDTKEGQAADQAGLRRGDVLLRWERAEAWPVSPEPAAGELESPFALDDVEGEQAPRGVVTLSGTRDGEPLIVRLSAGEWGLTVRPSLDGEPLAAYERGAAWIGTEEDEAGLSLWRQTALGLRAAGDHTQAAWLFLATARAAARRKAWLPADAAFAEAICDAEAAGDRALALTHHAFGRFLEQRGEGDRAAESYRASLGARRRLSPGSLGEARALSRLGFLARDRGDLDAAEEHSRAALAIQESLAPRSLDTAGSLDVLGSVARSRGRLTMAEEHLRRALDIREEIDPQGPHVASTLSGLGLLARDRGALALAEEYLRRALALRQAWAPDGLGVAIDLNNLGLVARDRGDLAAAEDYIKRALAINERLAPDTVSVAHNYNIVGLIAYRRGDLAAAEDYFGRALAIRLRQAPHSLDLAMSLHNLGQVANSRGDLVAGEEYHRRALALRQELAPESLDVARSLGALSSIARSRRDFAGARQYVERALAVREKLAPGSLAVAESLSQLGAVALASGDLTAADDFHGRALAIRETLAPESIDVAASLEVLGEIAYRRDDKERSRRLFERALAIVGGLAPMSSVAANVARSLGDLALAGGDLGQAETLYRRSLEIRRQQASGSAATAAAYRRLAVLELRRSRPAKALELYRAALDALDTQRLVVGGTGEEQTGVAAHYARYYREAVDLLVGLDRREEAFHVLERYRARGFLALLAERDLLFSADLSPELDRERRLANAAYDRALEDVAKAKDEEAREEKRGALRAAGARRAEVERGIRAASPRLAALQYPEPLDLPAVRSVLDPGTVLLSYSIGDEKSYVFAVGPGLDDFTARPLAVNRPTLRAEVDRLRSLVAGGGSLQKKRLDAQGQELSRLLLAPVANAIAGAERILILPDGPLHVLPFAALADPSSVRPRYLVESRPVYVAASATVFAELTKRRRATSAARLVAFGDPDYSAAAVPAEAGASPPLALQSARERGLELRPLPASRKEVLGLERLYSDSARTYVGSNATEENAKVAGGGAALLHFACHGIVDESSPLESSLALSLPRELTPGRDNGLLQAWEIFEQVRIDADLVTLSACGTALGKEMSGEGILGLTRAFQYAGARSVLASLWGVNDDSTAQLMRRFYGHLRGGRTKADALRAAQIEMMHRPASSHPYYWAAFQLIGDWR
jgi:CHAT domain-containing protein/tetratricopeptide (TPR) repeat protein